MILPIYTYGQGVLKKETEEIDSSYEGLDQLIKDMFETLRKSEGVGLAAPQVGLSIRLAVVDLDVMSDDAPEFKDYFKTFINPYIEETDGAMVPYEEGCLSFPGIHEKVTRPTRIRVRYEDAERNAHDNREHRAADEYEEHVDACKSGHENRDVGQHLPQVVFEVAVEVVLAA